jgi:hypothetical protein
MNKDSSTSQGSQFSHVDFQTKGPWDNSPGPKKDSSSTSLVCKHGVAGNNCPHCEAEKKTAEEKPAKK